MPPSRYVLVPADLVALVAEGQLTKEAAWLYIVLLGHHNRARKDNDVWPSRAVMAQGMGLKKPQSVEVPRRAPRGQADRVRGAQACGRIQHQQQAHSVALRASRR